MKHITKIFSKCIIFGIFICISAAAIIGAINNHNNAEVIGHFSTLN